MPRRRVRASGSAGRLARKINHTVQQSVPYPSVATDKIQRLSQWIDEHKDPTTPALTDALIESTKVIAAELDKQAQTKLLALTAQLQTCNARTSKFQAQLDQLNHVWQQRYDSLARQAELDKESIKAAWLAQVKQIQLTHQDSQNTLMAQCRERMAGLPNQCAAMADQIRDEHARQMAEERNQCASRLSRQAADWQRRVDMCDAARATEKAGYEKDIETRNQQYMAEIQRYRKELTDQQTDWQGRMSEMQAKFEAHMGTIDDLKSQCRTDLEAMNRQHMDELLRVRDGKDEQLRVLEAAKQALSAEWRQRLEDANSRHKAMYEQANAECAKRLKSQVTSHRESMATQAARLQEIEAQLNDTMAQLDRHVMQVAELNRKSESDTQARQRAEEERAILDARVQELHAAQAQAAEELRTSQDALRDMTLQRDALSKHVEEQTKLVDDERDKRASQAVVLRDLRQQFDAVTLESQQFQRQFRDTQAMLKESKRMEQQWLTELDDTKTKHAQALSGVQAQMDEQRKVYAQKEAEYEAQLSQKIGEMVQMENRLMDDMSKSRMTFAEEKRNLTLQLEEKTMNANTLQRRVTALSKENESLQANFQAAIDQAESTRKELERKLSEIQDKHTQDRKAYEEAADAKLRIASAARDDAERRLMRARDHYSQWSQAAKLRQQFLTNTGKLLTQDVADLEALASQYAAERHLIKESLALLQSKCDTEKDDQVCAVLESQAQAASAHLDYINDMIAYFERTHQTQKDQLAQCMEQKRTLETRAATMQKYLETGKSKKYFKEAQRETKDRRRQDE